MTNADTLSLAPRDGHHAVLKIVCTAVALGLCLLPIRAVTIGYGWYSLQRPFAEIPGAIIGGCYDVCYVIVTVIPFLIAARFLRATTWPRRILQTAYACFAVLSLLAALGTVLVVQMLGGPFNYRWLYYSDFLGNADSRDAMMSQLPPRALAIAAWASLAMLALAFALAWLLRRANRWIRARSIGLAILPALALYLFFAPWYLTTQRWDANKLANPISTFAISLVRSLDAPALYSMKTTALPDDVRTVAQRGSRAALPTGRGRGATVKNVILFVMESVPDEYVELYGGKYPVTPTLNKYRDRSIVFHDVYAHAPATNMSLVSILCSSYPWISYLTLTQEHPDVPLPSLGGELKSRGYRTAFFASGDLQYQGAGKFLAHRSFDLVQDFHDRRPASASGSFTSKQWAFLNGNDDMTTAESLASWIEHGDAHDHQPFFAMIWTLATHYPYYHPGPQTDFGTPEETQNRYLNALRDGDAALGRIMRMLEERKLLDDTLVVVVGDHGEAFGRHKQWGHGTHIYEENLRVPLIMINPRLFPHGQEMSRVAGVIDIAPTVLDLLNIELPGAWQGRSIFSDDRAQRVYFAAPWSDFLFGCRDGDRKLIFNATKNEYEVYDLKADPTEQRDLARESAEFVRAAQQHLAAWVQYQSRFYERAFKGEPMIDREVTARSDR